MAKVYKVSFANIWDGDRSNADEIDESKCVAASNAEDAIKATRKMMVKEKYPLLDDDGNEVPGKWTRVTDIVIHSVTVESELDLIA